MNMKKALAAITLSMMAVSVAEANSCTVYEHIDYGGAKMRLASGQNMAFVGQFWNDKVSSVRLGNRCRLTAYQHANYKGDRRVFTGQTRWVGNLWNDQISALQCKCPARPKPACTMYEHANFRGGKLQVRGKMRWVGNNWNDKVSAVKVPQRCKLTVYQHIDYGGDRRAFGPGNTHYVGNLWNDQISSAVCSCN